MLVAYGKMASSVGSSTSPSSSHFFLLLSFHQSPTDTIVQPIAQSSAQVAPAQSAALKSALLSISAPMPASSAETSRKPSPWRKISLRLGKVRKC